MQVLMTALDAGGGIRTFLRYVYGREDFADCELRLITADGTLADFVDRLLPPGRVLVREAPGGRSAFIAAVRRALREQPVDLLHSHGFTSGILTVLAHLGTGVPHLMTAHDVFNHGQFVGWKGLLRKRLIGQAFRRLDAIHTVTTEARQNFAEHFPEVDRARFVDILHGVDTAFFRQGRPYDLRAALDVPPDAPLIGFFGRFMNQKGFLDLVGAMERIVADHLLDPLPRVLTFGWGGFIREDYAEVAARGLGDFFIQAPHTDRMPDALCSVDVVAMPSRWEACGLLAMEALAAGAPLVGTSCVGLNEVLEDTPAYVVPPRCPEALAEALVEAIRAGRAPFAAFQPVACDRFAIARPARELRALYSSLGGSCPRARKES